MLILSYTFFISVLVITYFVMANKIETEFLTRYLLVILISSFFFFKIFHEQSALYVTLICTVGLVLNAKLPTINKFILILVAGIVVNVYRVPLSTEEFDDYLKATYGIECLVTECVEVVKIVSEDTMELQTNEYTIQGYSYNWYSVFSTGEIELNDKSIKAVNVMGFWFPLR